MNYDNVISSAYQSHLAYEFILYISVMISFLMVISNYYLEATTVFIMIFAKVAFNHHLHP